MSYPGQVFEDPEYYSEAPEACYVMDDEDDVEEEYSPHSTMNS